ncbi:hypothetical protein BGW39_003053 [Mortierella sp. 14UC]|nr:hypothetical protein BGW39_003053 [Mortierella sp. 14UC]
MSTTATPPATQVASSLPEILQALGAFLSHPDLRSCVLVCHQWNEVFTPWLWRIVEDYTLAWPRIIDQISPSSYLRRIVDTSNPATKKNERWLREIFTKHGSDIRDLHISSTPLLSNASAAGTCTRLRSLAVQSITPFRPFEEADALWELPVLKDLKPDDWCTEDQQRTIFSSHSLSPAFDDILMPLPAVMQDVFPRLFMSSQRLCLLIMENPDLETVELGWHAGVVAQFFSDDYVISLLASLPRLKRFNNHFMEYDLQSLLEKLPRLKHYERRLNANNYSDNTFDDVVLNRPFPRLRSLCLAGRGNVRAADVLNLLEFLPGLEQLTIASILPRLENSSDPEEFTRNKKHGRLQGLHITHPAHTVTRALDETLASLILPCAPFLTEITLRVLMPETAAVLAEQCKQLESLTVLDSAYSPSSTSSDVRTNAPPDNFPVLLLHGCPRLKRFLVTRHTIHIDKLLEKPIVCHELEAFCCRIVGVERLTSEEQVIYDSWAPAAKTTTQEAEAEAEANECEHAIVTITQDDKEQAEQILVKHQRILDQHHQVYDTFAGLVQLTTLDFGFEYLMPQRINSIVTPPLILSEGAETYEIDGRIYIKGYGPTPNTLILSLESGLGRLGSLRRLKEFGFRGVNHRVRKEELKWMVETWPRLEKVTGVSDFAGMETFGIDCPKTRTLTKFLQSLRPGILVY